MMIQTGVRSVTVHALMGIPMIENGQMLAPLLVDAIRSLNLKLSEQDILAVTQKIVSKSEGRIVRLSEITPSRKAIDLAEKLGRDPRKMEIILRESRNIIRLGPETIICETHRGQICANAGVDESNLSEPDTVLLQPENPDASAERLRREIAAELGTAPGVLITDSYGRPWRKGLVNVAIGASGFPVLVDLKGKPDSTGKTLQSTELAVADELAALAGLVMGKVALVPAAVITNFRWDGLAGRASDLLRPRETDLFR